MMMLSFSVKDYVVLKKMGKMGSLSKTGKEVIPFVYVDVGSFNEGLCGVKIGGEFGFPYLWEGCRYSREGCYPFWII